MVILSQRCRTKAVAFGGVVGLLLGVGPVAMAANSGSMVSPAATANSGFPTDGPPQLQQGTTGGVGAPGLGPQRTQVGAPFAGGDPSSTLDQQEEVSSDSPPTRQAGAAGRDEFFDKADLYGAQRNGPALEHESGIKGPAH